MSDEGNDINIYLISSILAAGGCMAGFFAVKYLLMTGFYALVIVGLLCGVFGGFMLKKRDTFFGIGCAVLSVIASIATQFLLMPFLKDPSFTYFIAHVHKLPVMTWIMIACGAYMAYAYGKGFRRKKGVGQ